MKTIEQWFSEYEVSHQNPKNKLIHYYCVPLITYSTLAIFHAVSMKPYLGLPFSLGLLIIALVSLFYLRLNWKLGVILAVSTLAMYGSFLVYPSVPVLLYTNIVIFLVSWLFQFLGHKWETAKPSFFEDLTFLLIGPLWVVNKALGIVGRAK